jgi:hypothetical protein
MISARPAEITSRITKLRRVAKEVEKHYRWGHQLAYSPPNDSHAEDIELGEKRRTGERSDPTKTLATDQRLIEMRARLEEAEVCIRSAEQQLLKAKGLLRKNFRNEEIVERGLFPRMVSRSQLAEAKSAKRRRDARGEGFGDA